MGLRLWRRHLLNSRRLSERFEYDGFHEGISRWVRFSQAMIRATAGTDGGFRRQSSLRVKRGGRVFCRAFRAETPRLRYAHVTGLGMDSIECRVALPSGRSGDQLLARKRPGAGRDRDRIEFGASLVMSALFKTLHFETPRGNRDAGLVGTACGSNQPLCPRALPPSLRAGARTGRRQVLHWTDKKPFDGRLMAMRFPVCDARHPCRSRAGSGFMHGRRWRVAGTSRWPRPRSRRPNGKITNVTSDLPGLG